MKSPDIQINKEVGILSSNRGEIAFDIDDDSISVLGISVFKRRCGIGSGLVKELEKFAIKQGIKAIVVPATPTKTALSFWLKAGYNYVFPEDAAIGNGILKEEEQGKIRDTDSGVIVLEKVLKN